MFSWFKVDFGQIYTMILGLIIYNIIKYLWEKSRKKGKNGRNYYVLKGNELLEQREKKSEQFIQQYSSYITEDLSKLIWDLPIKDLREKLLKDIFSVKQVALCYLLQCAKVGLEKKYICDIDYEKVLKEVDFLENLSQKEKQNLPLFGIPFGVKNSMSCQGLLNDFGFHFLAIDQILSSEDCEIVQKLKKLGAFPICITNIPQACIGDITSNDLWGRCPNPFDSKRTIGGSSGGSAGGVYQNCFKFALGTDLTGSVRGPSSYCGVVGFMPTWGKIGLKGIRNMVDGSIIQSFSEIDKLKGWRLNVGFICKNAADLDSIYTAYEENQHFTPIQQEINKIKKVGIVLEDDWLEFNEVQKKNLLEVKQFLEKKGYQVEEVNLRSFMKLNDLNFNLYMNEIKPRELATKCGGQIGILSENVQDLVTWSYVPRKANKLLEIHQEKLKIEKEFWNHLKKSEIDALITPTSYLGFATRNDYEGLHNEDYLAFANSLECPAGCVKFSQTPNNVQNYIYKSKQNDLITTQIQRSLKGVLNMPLSVQVLTPKNHEFQCIKLIQELEQK